MARVLFPADYFNPLQVDSDFSGENAVASSWFFAPMFLSCEGGYSIFGIQRAAKPTPVLYRGWMLSKSLYRKVYQYLNDFNYVLINSPDEYLAAHYFPFAYENLRPNLTPEIITFAKDDIYDDDKLKTVLEWLRSRKYGAILKDFAKSEKSKFDLFFVDSDVAEERFVEIISNFIEERGSLFAEGLVLKDFVKLKKYIGFTNEYRAYFLNGKLISLDRNTDVKDEIAPDRDWIFSLGDKISSNFFTIDVAELEDGTWTVIETGDGQVSSLAIQQNPIDFYMKIRELYPDISVIHGV